MNAVDLARLQFAFTASVHYLFPPMSIGLGLIIVILEGIYLAKKNEFYLELAKFWTKIFALFFVMGVVTGFVQVFAFGNNWSQYSRFVGDVFGSILAAEGIFAFFLEAGFIGVMLFGWNKVKPWFHYLSTILVALGATFSATWIVMANSWMQTPDGYQIVGEGIFRRAVITDIWKVYFNPSFFDRIVHVLLGCWILGAFLLLSVSAYYMLKKKYANQGKFGLKLGLSLATIFLLLQLWSADSTARGVLKNQPIKLAAMEGVFKTETPSAFCVFGWPLPGEGKTIGLKIPGFLSILSYRDLSQGVKGLEEFPKEEWPNVLWVFQSYHVMIYCWGIMMFLAILGIIFWPKNRLENKRWFLWLLVFSVFLPYVANIAGWFTAELGRQPWIVQGILRTADAASRVVSSADIITSLIMFLCIYGMLISLFFFLLNRKIKHGPVSISNEPDDAHYRDQFLQERS